MSLLLTANDALRRWRDANPDQSPPPVAVFSTLWDGPVFFTGLAIQPTPHPGVCAISGAGGTLPVYILRESDLVKIIIGESMVGSRPFGFNRGE